MHDKHLNRPTLDDNVDEEKSIDFLTQEITQARKMNRIILLTVQRYSIIFVCVDWIGCVDFGRVSEKDQKIVNQEQLELNKIVQRSAIAS